MNEESTIHPQNRPRRRSAWLGPLTLVLLFLVAMLVVSLFFRVSEISVVNASEYSDEEIIAASGVEEGANLFFVDRFKAASMIFSDLPYMDTVSIRRQLPNKIIIQAEGSAPVAWLRLDGEYWLLDRKGKLLGTVSQSEAEKYPEIRSLEPMTAIAGVEMMVEGDADERRLAYYTGLLSPLSAEGLLPYIQWIDLKNLTNPSLRFDGRITVYLGETEDLAYEAALLRDVTEHLAADDSGTLYYTGGNSWTFSPN